MSRRILFALIARTAAHAAEPTGCFVRKGLYEAWLSSVKRSPTPCRGWGPLGVRSTAEPASTQEIHDQYQSFFQCLSDSTLPADDDGGRSLQGSRVDRIGFLVCRCSLPQNQPYCGTEFWILCATKGAEMIWDLMPSPVRVRSKSKVPTLRSQRTGVQIIDEVFVLPSTIGRLPCQSISICGRCLWCRYAVSRFTD
jgi:hypothetical protein